MATRMPSVAVALLLGGCGNVEPLELVTRTVPSGRLGQGYDHRLAARGGQPPYEFEVTSGALPAGLNLKRSTGQIFGVPQTPGSHRFRVRLLDRDQAQIRDLELWIAPAAFRIDPTPLPLAFASEPYEAQLVTRGGSSSARFGLRTGSLPNGLRLASDGRISGVPEQAGEYRFMVVARDDDAREAFLEIELRVVARDRLRITTSSLAPGILGLPYAQPLLATGGRPPYRFETTDVLPPGLTLDPEALLGTPEATGRFIISVRVEDARGDTEATDLSLDIVDRLQLLGPRLFVGRVNEPFEAAFSAAGGTPPYRWSLPDGVPFGFVLGADGRLTGTPRQTGDITLRLRVENEGQTSETTIQISIRDTQLYPATDVPVDFPGLCDTSTHVSYRSVSIDVPDSFQIQTAEVFVDVTYHDRQAIYPRLKLVLWTPGGRPIALCGHGAGYLGSVGSCPLSDDVLIAYGPNRPPDVSLQTLVGLNPQGSWRFSAAIIRPRSDAEGCLQTGQIRQIVLALDPDPSPEPYVRITGFTANNLIAHPWARITGGGLPEDELFLAATKWHVGPNGRREGGLGDDVPDPTPLTWAADALPIDTTLTPDGYVRTGTVTSQGYVGQITATDPTGTASVTVPLWVTPPDWVPDIRAF